MNSRRLEQTKGTIARLTSEDHGTTVGKDSKLHAGNLLIPSDCVARYPACPHDGFGKINVARLAWDGIEEPNTNHGEDHEEDVEPNVDIGEPREAS